MAIPNFLSEKKKKKFPCKDSSNTVSFSTSTRFYIYAFNPKPPQNPYSSSTKIKRERKMRFPTETITLPSYETALKVAGALVTSAVVYRTISDTLIPDSVSDYFHSRFQNFLIHFRSQVPIIIEEFDGLNQNNIFYAANIYLGAKLSSS